MENCNILSLLWEKRYYYDLTEEELLVENTFIQQTSKGENLWKAQLGMTENYVVFLRCDTDFFSDVRNPKVPPDNINLLINMVPVSHLKVKKYSNRKLEVLFPSGSVCYFKLLMCSGCGKAWTQWRALERKCDTDILPFVPRSNLISLSNLNHSIQKIIMDQKFFSCFADLKKYLRKTTHAFQACSDLSGGTRLQTTTVSELKPDIEFPVVGEVFKNVDQKEKLDTKDDLGVDITEIPKAPADKKKKKRKTRQIRRFGEGIPENCVFDLTLSYSDEIVANNGQKIKTDEENSGMCELIPLEERAAKIMGRSFTDSESEKDKMTFISKKKKKNKKKRKFISMKQILNTAQYFTNLSLLIIPDGLRKSKSVDSVYEIPTTNSDEMCITSYASLPNVNDIDFHRRYKRLLYSADYFDDTKDMTLSENHYTHPVSFWLPDKNPEGRIYCTSPVCRREARATNVSDGRLRDIVQKITEQLLLSDHYYDLSGKRKNKQEKEKLSVLMKRILSTSEDAYTPEKSNAISEDTPARVEEVVRRILMRIDSKPNVKNKPKKERTFLDPSALSPYETAYELQVIQQRMFCEIESPELARYILKPHTVTEVNCPYLCGFLLFFDRLKTLITTEISTQTEVKEAARIFQVFVQIATACLKGRDEQSTYAIISGLCNPIILSNKEFWTNMLQDNEGVNCLNYLFKLCRKKKTLPTTHQKIPFFLSFISFIVESMIKQGHTFSSSRMEKESPWNVLKISNQKTKTNIKRKKVFSELRVLSYENHENVLAIIEDCRKFFHSENSSTKDIATRQYLLYKQFKGVHFI